MPVLELAPGGQHHRVGIVRQLGWRQHLGRREPAAAVVGREAVAEHDLLARRLRPVARIGDRALALQPLPGDVGERGHGTRHLVVDLARMLVVPVEPDPACDLLDDPPVLTGIARQRQRPAAHLHLPVGVGDGAVLLRPGRGRQHHVRVHRGLGQEQVLHHQMLELGQRRAGVVGVRVGHRRVLAHDVHALDRAGVDRVDDLDHGQAGLGVELGAPQLLEARAHLVLATLP